MVGPMKSFFRNLPHFPLLAFAFTALPVVAAFLAPDPQAARAWTATTERGAAFGILVAAAFLCFTRRSAASADSRYVPVRTSNAWWFLPLLPILVHQSWYLWTAYESLYLADTDFTNMSAVLADAAGGGFFRTPYLATGARESYLGHHFSPGLFLLTPLYLMAGILGSAFQFRPTHLVYGFALWTCLAAGLYLTARVSNKTFRDDPPLVRLTAALIPVVMIPLWRIAQSFHFEVLVFPAAALTFLGLMGRRGLFWPGIVFWLSVKEDAAVYVLLLGAWLVSQPAERRRGIIVVLLAVVWGMSAHFIRNWVAGGLTPDWGSYWADRWGSQRQLWPSVLMLASVGFLPVFAPRFLLCCVFPVLALHALSYHPWHQAYTGHYSYSALPFLLLGSYLGLRSIITSSMKRYTVPIVLSLLAVMFFVAANEKESPAGLLIADPRRDVVMRLADALPRKSCVQAHRRFSPRVPIDAEVFPLIGAEGNPWRGKILPATVPQRDPRCADWFVLVDWNEPMIPYYSTADLAALRKIVDQHYERIGGTDGIQLYRLR